MYVCPPFVAEVFNNGGYLGGIQRLRFRFLQQASFDGNIRRHFGLCGSDLGRGHDRIGDRLVVAAALDRVGVPRMPVEAPVRLDGSAWARCAAVLVRFYGAFGVFGLPAALVQFPVQEWEGGCGGVDSDCESEISGIGCG